MTTITLWLTEAGRYQAGGSAVCVISLLWLCLLVVASVIVYHATISRVATCVVQAGVVLGSALAQGRPHSRGTPCDRSDPLRSYHRQTNMWP